MSSRSSFRQRHPGWAAVISLSLGPELGMFYLGKGRVGILYSILGLLIFYALPFLLTYQQISYPVWLSVSIFAAYRLAATMHVYVSASRQSPRDRYPWFAKFQNWIVFFWLGPLLLALLVRNLLIQPYTIPGNSMRPALENGDYIISEKITFGIGQYSLMFGLGPAQRFGSRLPKRGEIIVFALPLDPKVSYVKRVIGLPGDRIMVQEGRLYLNGAKVERTPLSKPAIRTGPGETLYLERLPDGTEYPILEMSDVSRGDNTVEWQVPNNHYFVMGDNRDNSLDSRFDVGFVPFANIESRPLIILYNDSRPNRSFSRVQ
jgi:signal peptidase I